MSETEGSTGPMTAGRLLREARQAQGLHIAALANAIKVAPRKLELLEADRLEELPDATFTRALAQTVCRALKIDPAPVLALLPRPDSHRLSHLGEGLNTPFRPGGAGAAPHDDAPWLRPAIWGPALLLIVAAAVYLLPAGWLPAPPWRDGTRSDAAARSAPGGEAMTTSSAASAPTAVASEPLQAAQSSTPLPTEDSASAPSQVSFGASAPIMAEAPEAAASSGGAAVAASAAAPVATAATPAADDASHALVLHVSGDSWIEVVDAHGKALLARTVKSGESVALDGAVPLKLRIGNAPATAVIFRGQPVALAPYTRDNLARLELR